MSFEKFLVVDWNTFVPSLPTENFFAMEGLLKLLYCISLNFEVFVLYILL